MLIYLSFLGEIQMKKITFLFSVIVMAASLSGCGNTNTTASDTQSYKAESTAESVTESTTEQLIEIDPFEGIDIVELYHEFGGVVYEYPLESKGNPEYDSDYLISYGLYFDDKPFSEYSKEEVTNFDSNVKCTVKIYDSNDNGLVYGDELVEMVKSKYGILLTETEKELPWAFKEKEPIEIDPFEGIEKFYTFDTIDQSNYSLNVIGDFSQCEGGELCFQNNAPVEYDMFLGDKSLFFGEDYDLKYNLHDGDVVTIKAFIYNNGNPCYGDDINEYLAKEYIPVKLTSTEKEVIVTSSKDTNE